MPTVQLVVICGYLSEQVKGYGLKLFLLAPSWLQPSYVILLSLQSNLLVNDFDLINHWAENHSFHLAGWVLTSLQISHE